MDISGDFVTFFLRGGDQRSRVISGLNGENIVTAYVNGDGWDEKDITGAVKSLGGIKVTITPANSSARISTHNTQIYEPPSKMLLLKIDRPPQFINIKSFDFDQGDHLVIPVDKDSEQMLQNLRKNLEYLPSDYGISMMNLLRRPSLEMRIARLENMSGVSLGRAKDGARGLRQKAQSGRKWWNPGTWGNRELITWALVFVLLGYLLGQVTPLVLREWVLSLIQGSGSNTPKVTVKSPVKEGYLGQAVEITVRIASSGRGSTAVPTGTVQLQGSVSGQETTFSEWIDLNSGAAKLNTDKLPAGVENLTIAYSGDRVFAPATGKLALIIKKMPTKTTLQPSRGAITAKVACDQTKYDCGSLVPSGRVEFLDNHGTLGIVDLDRKGSAQFQNLGAGSEKIEAHYQGDSNFDPSQAEPISVKSRSATQ